MTNCAARAATGEILVISKNVLEIEDLSGFFRSSMFGEVVVARTSEEACALVQSGVNPKITLIGLSARSESVRAVLDLLRSRGCRLILVDQPTDIYEVGDARLERPYTTKDVRDALIRSGMTL